MKLLDKNSLAENIEQIARYDLDNHNLFGSSYFVYQNGEIMYKKHFGYVDEAANECPDDNTVYRLASMTKPITAVAIMILVDRGIISLDDTVSKYLPGFKDVHIISNDGIDLGRVKSEVTIKHCLTHTSGLNRENSVTFTGSEKKSNDEIIRRFIEAGLAFEPFTQQAYSGYAAFQVLGAVVKSVTGQGYGEFLKKEIFDPCDMCDTTFSPTKEHLARIMTMHSKVNDISVVSETCPGCVFERIPYEQELAGAGLVSTLKDYSNFAKMLLNKGEINGRRILSEQAIREMSTPQVPKEIMPGNERWGLGVRVVVEEAYPSLSVGSFGWSGAYGSHFWIDPENNICAVFMKNSRVDGGSGNASARRFEKAVSDALI
ncbi:MAG: beta-lactamase family protein [Clostridia bacterium]|nr:beta-lactamase family protein [Clostridia bacterium]